jgi:hypothetical protein
MSEELLRVAHVTHAVDRESGVRAPAWWLNTEHHPDVADLARVVADDPDSGVASNWRIGGTTEGPMIALQVELIAPVHCTFVVYVDPVRERALLDEVIERNALGLVLASGWQEGAQLHEHHVLPVEPATDRLRLLLDLLENV